MKNLLYLLTIPLIITCTTNKILLDKDKKFVKPDTVYIKTKTNPLDSLSGKEAYIKSQELYEKAETEYYKGNDSLSTKLFQDATKLFSQSHLTSEDYFFLNPLEQIEKLKTHKKFLKSKENGIVVSKEEIDKVLKNENNQNISKKLAEKIAYYKIKFQTKNKAWFKETSQKLNNYSSFIDSLLIEKNLPKIVKFLYPIESGMNTKIHSWAGAAGISQFMKETAEHYGLKVEGEWYDERLDPLKSIPASMNYLKYIESRLNNINLSISSYNLGESEIIRRINKAKVSNFEELLDSGILPRETENYLPKIYAFMELTKETKQITKKENIILENLLKGNFETVKIKEPTGIDVMAELLNISEKKFREYNPAYNMHSTPPKRNINESYSYEIRVPIGKKDKFIEKLSKVKIRIKNPIKFYRIKQGDTLGKIAKKYKTSIRRLRNMNPKAQPRKLRIGAKLKVPVR